MSCKSYNDFKDLSCKINFKKKLTLPCNKPNIKCIKNINVNVDILGSKVTSTSLNEIVTKENLNFAKERLLIAGWICLKIYYISSYNSNCINTAFFKVPFNTYIPLNKSSTCCKDIFSINSCIKNIRTTICNSRNFEQKLTLILSAKKIVSINPTPPTPIKPNPGPKPPIPPTPDPPSIKKLPNAIIINNNNFREIARIEFNSTNKKFLVTSKSLIADSSLGSDSYFSLVLKNNNTIKTSASIISNKTADDFSTILNNTPFSYGDILELNYLLTSRFLITNFPKNNENFVPIENKEIYIITEQGFIPVVTPEPTPDPRPLPEPSLTVKLPNTVIITSASNEEIAKVEFNATDKLLIVDFTGKIPDNTKGNTAYFILSLQDEITSEIKASASIMSNQNAKEFKDTLNGIAFDEFDILQLNCFNPSNIKITNFQVQDEVYTLNDNLELFSITPNGLEIFKEPTPPPTPIKDKLPNAIIIKQNNGNNNGPVALIEFNTLENKLIVTSSSIIPDSSKTSNYFSLKLKDPNNQNIKYSSIITSNNSADNFANTLNYKNFQFNDLLELDYLIPNSIIITNYPKEEQNYTPTINKEVFKITTEGLLLI